MIGAMPGTSARWQQKYRSSCFESEPLSGSGFMRPSFALTEAIDVLLKIISQGEPRGGTEIANEYGDLYASAVRDLRKAPALARGSGARAAFVGITLVRRRSDRR
jgi:hypothetical protein